MNPVTARARELRRSMSDAEKLLWSRLRHLRDRGFKMRRQAPFKGYFLDFVCYARRVVIEVDGGQHTDDLQADRDLVRDKILRRHGFVVLRVRAAEVHANLIGVIDRVIAALEAAPDVVAERRYWKPGAAAVRPVQASPP